MGGPDRRKPGRARDYPNRRAVIQPGRKGNRTMPIYTIRTTAQAMISEYWRVEADDETDARNMLADGSAEFISHEVVGDETDRDIEEMKRDGGALANALSGMERAKDEAGAMVAALREILAMGETDGALYGYNLPKVRAKLRAILARIDGTTTTPAQLTDDAGLAEAAEGDICEACGRASIECSRAPCPTVIAERGEGEDA